MAPHRLLQCSMVMTAIEKPGTTRFIDSWPNYLMLLSSLPFPEHHRPRYPGIERYFPVYVPKYIDLTISHAGLCPVTLASCDYQQTDARAAGHRFPDYRPLRNSNKRSSGRYRPGLPLGGVVLSRISCFKARFASR
jgi:hypothetical protein